MIARATVLLVLLASPAAADVCDNLQTDDDQAKCLAQCEAKKPEACARVGLHWAVTGNAAQIGRGVALLERACKAKSAFGCGALGSVTLLGKQVKRDVPRALLLLETGCKGGDGLSCESLGGWYAQGGDAPDKIDLAAATLKSAPYYERACTLKRPAPCAFLATFITNGAKISNADKKRVPGLLDTACNGGVTIACKMLGDIYSKGELVKRDVEKANELYAKACKAGYDRGCSARAE